MSETDNYILNVEKSREIYNKYKSRLEVKMCYNNIFKISSLEINKFYSGEWKIAYGYMSIMDTVLYARHCFILEGNNVIDPTLFTNPHPDTNRKYLVFKIFDNYTDYTSSIENEDYKPALERTLRKLDLQLVIKEQKNGLFFTS